MPVEWLFGAPTRYDRFGRDCGRVAAEASLDAFLESTPEGRAVESNMIQLLRSEAQKKNAPRTIAAWKDKVQTVLLGAEYGVARSVRLESMVAEPDAQWGSEAKPRSRKRPE